MSTLSGHYILANHLVADQWTALLSPVIVINPTGQNLISIA